MREGSTFADDLGPGRHRARIDLHLHSHASNVTDYYASNSLAIPESYSEPLANYRLLKDRGMALVTLTDHNSIDGVKELLDHGLDDVFISAEMTTSFPEDGCNIHVTVANVSEEEFAEVDRLRGNVYEMVDYLDRLIAAETGAAAERRIAYFMTHPLMSTQNRPYGREGALSVAHVEKALLLFNCLEVRNGTRARSFNAFTSRLISALTPELIVRLADRHGLEPKGKTPWLKAVTGGSDDHSGINPGRTWTEFACAGDRPTPNDVIDSIRARTTRAGGQHGGPVTLAHALVKLLYDGQHSRHRPATARPMKMCDPLNLLLGFAFEKDAASLRERVTLRSRIWFQNVVGKRLHRLLGREETFERILLDEAQTLLAAEDFRESLARTERTDDRIFLVISSLLNRLFLRYLERIKGNRRGDLVRTIKESIALITSNLLVSLPYFICYSHQSTDKLLLRDLRRDFGLQQREKLVLVTDTFFDVNGVALTIRKMIAEADRRELDFTVVTCLGAEERQARLAEPEIADLVARGRLQIFESIVSLDLPEYRGLQVRLMPFLEFLRFVQEGGFTRMQISTPGPVGATALLAAKLLQIETSSTYHTSFPEYVENYTGDVSLEALTWKYMILFYHSVDEVVVPSRFIAQLLHQRGLRKRKLLVLDRWVDVRRFAPEHCAEGFWPGRGFDRDGERVTFVYLGRLGAEKNLDLMARAFRRLHDEDPRAALVLIGDGPYRETLARLLEGLPVFFSGFLGGEELPRALASCDVKLFPSTTDTWGNAPLEAQASGLPVVVSDKGGPQELMEDGVTGFRVAGGDEDGFLAAMRRLMDDELRRTMGAAARSFAVANEVLDPYSAILDSEGYRRRRKSAKHLAEIDLSADEPGELVGPGMSWLVAPAGLAALYCAVKARRRLQLSRAKHRSLPGHARLSRRVARLLPYFEYEADEFYGCDGAPAEVRELRALGLSRLGEKLTERSPRTIAMTRELRERLSDLRLTDNYRVPFQFRKHLARHIELGVLLEESSGRSLRDLDGNWSLDLTGAYGMNVFGFEFYKDCIDRAVERARPLGPVLGLYHPVILDNVRRLREISGLDEVSFHMSGTEAVMQATALARYHSGRSKIVRFCGAYHGWWDGVQPGVGNPRRVSDVYTLAEMSEASLRVLDGRRDIACVLINPIQAMHPNGAAPGDATLVSSSRRARYDKAAYADWLRRLREVCDRRGIVLILDEVFMGFRLAYGGAQEYFGVKADIVTYGKTLGGGLPIGVVCGRADLMKRYRDDRPSDLLFARGTFNSHPYVMTAMNEFLSRLDQPELRAGYARLDEVWDERARALDQRMAERDLPVRFVNMTSVWTTLFERPSRHNWMYQFYLRAEGLTISWVGSGRFIFSHDYRDDEFAEVADRLLRAAEAMAADGWWWQAPGQSNRSISRTILKQAIGRILGRRR